MITSLCFDTKYPLPRDEVFSNCFVSLRNLIYLVRRLRISSLRSNIEGVVRAASLGCPAIGEWKWGVGDIGPTIYVGGGMYATTSYPPFIYYKEVL
jgi:hypothetical protein